MIKGLKVQATIKNKQRINSGDRIYCSLTGAESSDFVNIKKKAIQKIFRGGHSEDATQKTCIG